MLKYEKTKAKLREFSVQETQYPDFPFETSDLMYSTIYVLSLYCESVDSDNYRDLIDVPKEDLKVCAQYFEYVVQAEDNGNYDSSLLLLGATSYFFLENFGNAKVLIRKIEVQELLSEIEKLLYRTLYLLLFNENDVPCESVFDNNFSNFLSSLEKHFFNGESYLTIESDFEKIVKDRENSNDGFDVTYIDFFRPIFIISKEYSSWIVLPKWSGTDLEAWVPYLSLRNSIHLLWPAQKMIIEENVLQNENCIVPLPTGVGKTKSFEIIIYYKLFIQNKRNSVIIAPLKALCNEITLEIKNSFKSFQSVRVTKFTEVYQEDNVFEESLKNIIIATPEKFTFVLRHKPQFIDYFDLFIFDEAHLFDDSTRGANYELLVADIKRLAYSESQMILFSAILSNSYDISNWLFDETKVVTKSQKIETSEKSIGYLSRNAQIHYYENGEYWKEAFFVPSIVETTNLNSNGKNSKKWFFPKIESGTDRRKDLCIYFANRLVNNGAVAIFAGVTASIKTIMRRMLEINSRKNIENCLQNLLEDADVNQTESFQNLFILHYGEGNVFADCASLGVLPHYAALNEGVRESIEFAIKNGDVNVVICTSTLAEGVNIPLKYLIIYSLSQGTGKMENRKISNLIGRTARSGVFTEGSIIMADETLYDMQFSDWKSRRVWRDNRIMFSNHQNENCNSNFLLLVEPYSADFGNHTLPYDLFYKMFNHWYLDATNWKFEIRNSISLLTKGYSIAARERAQNYLSKLFHIIDSLENYLSFIYVDAEDEVSFINEVSEIAKNTFGFYLASIQQKELLESIFQLVAIKVKSTINDENQFFYSKSLYGFDVSVVIFEWLKENEARLTILNHELIIEETLNLFYEIYRGKIGYELDDFTEAAKNWMTGIPIYEIQEVLDENDFQKLEKVLSQNISFDFNFFLGSIIDGINDENEGLIEKIKQIQKRAKYGVDNSFCMNFCEKIINDRMIARKIYALVGNGDVKTNIFPSIIISNSDAIFRVLKEFPRYYTIKVHHFMESN